MKSSISSENDPNDNESDNNRLRLVLSTISTHIKIYVWFLAIWSVGSTPLDLKQKWPAMWIRLSCQLAQKHRINLPVTRNFIIIFRPISSDLHNLSWVVQSLLNYKLSHTSKVKLEHVFWYFLSLKTLHLVFCFLTPLHNNMLMKSVSFKRLVKEVVLELVVSYWINWTFITSQLGLW